jgi:hypothetical protein
MQTVNEYFFFRNQPNASLRLLLGKSRCGFSFNSTSCFKECNANLFAIGLSRPEGGHAVAVALYREEKQGRARNMMNHPTQSRLDNPECILLDQNHYK